MNLQNNLISTILFDLNEEKLLSVLVLQLCVN